MRDRETVDANTVGEFVPWTTHPQLTLIDAHQLRLTPPLPDGGLSLPALSPILRRPAFDAHRLIARPCLHPTVLGMELLGDRGWGWAARYAA